MASITMFAGNFAPRQFAFCQGQTLAISSNTALFALLGTTFGGNGQTTFQLPNLASRVPVGTGQGPGLSIYELGQQGGTENTTLLLTNMPAHTHAATGTFQATSTANALAGVPGSSLLPAPTGHLWSNAQVGGPTAATLVNGYAASGSGTAATMAAGAVSTTVTGTITNSITGGSIPFNNLSPYLGMNYIICTQGIFPSRN